MKIKAKIDRMVNSGNVKAIASVSLDGMFVVKNLKIMDGRKELFVSMPQETYSGKDGQKKYSNLFFALTNSAKLELQETVLQAYQQQIDPNYTPKQSYQNAVGTLVRSDHKGISCQCVSDDKCIVELHNLIRRLTPLECERLQGFPDGWTNIPGASDSARYKALGNSVAIPCVEYIMRGIALVLRSGAGGREEKG